MIYLLFKIYNNYVIIINFSSIPIDLIVNQSRLTFNPNIIINPPNVNISSNITMSLPQIIK